MNRLERKKKLIALLILRHLTIDDEDEEYMLHEHWNLRKKVSEIYNKRENEGIFKMLINNHLVDEEQRFKSYFRVTREMFAYILNLVEGDLTTASYNRVKTPITAAEKLALTLRFLATGESFRSLAFGYRISPSAISTFVPKVLAAIQKQLVPIFLPSPDQINWNQKAEEFKKRWDFPNCVAAIDGKHVRIVAPSKSGSLYFNFKGFFSIVLLAMFDANCKFVVIDVGSYGKEGDAGIFNKSKMGLLVKNETIFPPSKFLPHSNILLPHVIVGDEAFRLSEHIMKPYSKAQMLEDPNKRKFNYRLSKARRVSENAFGIMCAIFRIFFTPINLKPETVDSVIVVCCCLHNMLRDDYIHRNPSQLVKYQDVEDFPTQNMIPLAGTGGFTKTAVKLAPRLCHIIFKVVPYFCNLIATICNTKKKIATWFHNPHIET